jgi:hypothetical protein
MCEWRLVSGYHLRLDGSSLNIATNISAHYRLYTAVNRLHCALDGVDLLGLFVSIRLTLHPY